MADKLKILYIDPWCANGSNLFYYSTGLVGALSKKADVTLVCAKDCSFFCEELRSIERLFFRLSNRMKKGPIRTIIRGVEYVATYRKINKLAIKRKFDLIHIEWPLFYRFDSKMFKLLKKHCSVFSIKAHNVIPHSSGKKYIEVFNKIYQTADVILVHGLKMKEKLCKLFPNSASKVSIQHHGVYSNFENEFDLSKIDPKIVNLLEKYKRIYLFFGRIDNDKGVDRIVSAWGDFATKKESMLIIAGMPASGYDFGSLKNQLALYENVFVYDKFVSDNFLNFLFTKCNIVLLPYIDGSMSGVVFTASQFSKPILSTDFGVVSEYLVNDENSFVTNNDYLSFYKKLVYIDDYVSNEKLAKMGLDLTKHINTFFSWDSIASKLVEETYRAAIIDCEKSR